MRFFCLVICIIFGSNSALYIEKDSALVPVHFHPDKEIEYEVEEAEFSYRLDLDLIPKLKREYLLIADICYTFKSKQLFYKVIFNPESVWNYYSKEKPKTKNVIDIEPYAIQALKSDYFHFKTQNNSNFKCSVVESFVNHLSDLDSELKKVINSSYASISSLIPVKTLLKNASEITSNSELISPLDFAHWFGVNFFKYAKIDFTLSKNLAFVTVRVPLFEHTILSKIFPKPVIYDRVPYVLNTQSEYLVEGQIGHSYFSSLKDNCFYAVNRTFCWKPKHRNDCDTQYLSQTLRRFQRKCFSRLPLHNVVTKIKNNVYFMVYTPMTINVTCNNTLQSIRLFQSSKILNNTCDIRSEFFNLTASSAEEYEIFYSNRTENASEWDIFQNSELEELINFYGFSSFLLAYLVTLSIFILFYCKLKVRDSQPPIFETLV